MMQRGADSRRLGLAYRQEKTISCPHDCANTNGNRSVWPFGLKPLRLACDYTGAVGFVARHRRREVFL